MHASLVKIGRTVSVVVTLVVLTACSTRLESALIRHYNATLLSTNNTLISDETLNSPLPPGYYRVKSGDTLYQIALANDQNYRDIATWNNLINIDSIKINQLLRVVPLKTNISPSLSSIVAETDLERSSYSLVPAIASVAIQLDSAVGNINFVWPIRGLVLNKSKNNQGLTLSGALGTAVKASAEGRIVYAGDGLYGYKNLIVIKHNKIYLSAYSNNGTTLVKEGDFVKKGQIIAELEHFNLNKAILYFEIRKQGKPVDPINYLPPQ
ncbi:peptidoglycan DD-metalloendopeptidase family protein [Candidatus Vallotia tarda]|uniref:Lipoprotein NlpD/LppB homolog n=1 Tax=Candidatus Vallotiella hemipterorum TaxID=1177213 RepID=A0A916NV47_9BURK|nr:peptidoglycan DD-metalloendopeptidase family protein [Candidatus Vallotia tarda]CAG7602842.1 Lipoprotein NlpD/LppB homolog [Candidatus Vallotia tarda]